MSGLTIPSEGITILHDQHHTSGTETSSPPQILQLNLTESITKDILKSLRNDEQVRLKLGRKPTLNFGKRSVQLDHGTDDFTSEIFMKPADGSDCLYFSGKLSHTLEVQQARQATAGADTALATLQNNLKSIQEERAFNEAGLVTSKLSKKDHRPSPMLGKDRFLSGSTPGSPFLSGAFSPRVGPTSAPSFGATQSKDKIRQDAIKIPMIHLLAISPMTPKELAKKLHVNQADCDKVLERVARDAKGAPGKKELKDKPYRELDLWKFHYPSQHDRQVAIDHTVSAFDRMRIDKSDPLWQMLLAKEDRGKGINLSRLNFDKPIPTGNITPRIPERSTDGSTESKSVVSDHDAHAKRAKEAAAKLNNITAQKSGPIDSIHKVKPTREPNKSHAGKDKASGKTAVRPAKQAGNNSKFKSAERIEDSDEEAEAVDTVTSSHPAGAGLKRKEKTSETANSKSNLGPKPSKPASFHATHKSRPSNSSNSSSDTGSLEPATKSSQKPTDKRSQNTDSAKSKISPRPRTDSSPQKPSPLGSSPPANSTDADNSSISSKGASQSSAPSSPPSSGELSEPRRSDKYSPVVSERKLSKMSNGIHKRKAEGPLGEPLPKRQQVNGSRFNSLPNDLSDNAPTQNEHAQSNVGASAGKSPLTKDEVIENARSFQKYYNRYKELHERIERVPEKERDDKELDKVWKMHMRLQEMKADIWKDWERVS